jgi:hypothetical protein
MAYQYNNKNRQYNKFGISEFTHKNNNSNQQNRWNKNVNSGFKKSYQKSEEQLSYEQSLRDMGVIPNCDMTSRQRFDRVLSMLEGLECEIDYIVNVKKTWWEK